MHLEASVDCLKYMVLYDVYFEGKTYVTPLKSDQVVSFLQSKKNFSTCGNELIPYLWDIQ